MNAPISAALLAARARATLPRTFQPEQPQVPADLTCLMVGYLHDGLVLDLYGYADEDEGCSVEAVTLTGSTVDISALVSYAQMHQMGAAVDRAAVRAKQASRAEQRAEILDWQRRS
jgi:hypothetical protein